jgi:hypothetical protein
MASIADLNGNEAESGKTGQFAGSSRRDYRKCSTDLRICPYRRFTLVCRFLRRRAERSSTRASTADAAWLETMRVADSSRASRPRGRSKSKLS